LDKPGQTGGLLGDGANANKLLRVVSAEAAQQFRVRSKPSGPDFKTGLKAPICDDLRPNNHPTPFNILKPVFIV
jgi:hypothetical protein